VLLLRWRLMPEVGWVHVFHVLCEQPRGNRRSECPSTSARLLLILIIVLRRSNCSSLVVACPFRIRYLRSTNLRHRARSLRPHRF